MQTYYHTCFLQSKSSLPTAWPYTYCVAISKLSGTTSIGSNFGWRGGIPYDPCILSTVSNCRKVSKSPVPALSLRDLMAEAEAEQKQENDRKSFSQTKLEKWYVPIWRLWYIVLYIGTSCFMDIWRLWSRYIVLYGKTKRPFYLWHDTPRCWVTYLCSTFCHVWGNPYMAN